LNMTLVQIIQGFGVPAETRPSQPQE
jgi:hypothetical protein